jgi:uncharacterized membrane protein YgaE (UPF0421/DUF939 family)
LKNIRQRIEYLEARINIMKPAIDYERMATLRAEAERKIKAAIIASDARAAEAATLSAADRIELELTRGKELERQLVTRREERSQTRPGTMEWILADCALARAEACVRAWRVSSAQRGNGAIST